MGFHVSNSLNLPMRPSDALRENRETIRNIVRSHRALNPRVFGSTADGSDKDGSDLDLLIDPTPDTTLMDVAAIQVALESLLGVPVDVVTPKALPDSFRDEVIAQAIPL